MLLSSPNISSEFFIVPLTSENQKNIANYSVDAKLLHYYILELLKSNINLTPEVFAKLNIIDYVMILIQYRMFYVGQKSTNTLQCKCGNKFELAIDFLKMAHSLDEVFNISHEKIVQHDNITYSLNMPSILHVSNMIQSDISSWMPLIINKINDFEVSMCDINKKIEIYEHLPLEVAKEIMEYLKDKMNLRVDGLVDVSCQKCKTPYKIDTNLLNFIYLIQDIIYNFNYETCLHEYRLLAEELKLPPTYVAGISPIEKYKYIQMAIEKRETKSSNESEHAMTESSEFGF